MVSRGIITVTTACLCLLLGILSLVPAAVGSHGSCCTSYTRKPVPFKRITGYREQTTKENCRIEAIIFYTVKKLEVCATRKDEWVRRNLDLLSLKLQKMSKSGSAAGETPTSKTGNPTVPDGSGSLISTTEAYLNGTESFY